MTGNLPDSAASLYRAEVVHKRFSAPSHRFVYGVFNLLLDIDQLDRLARRRRLFSHNSFNLFSFFDRDHGPKDGSPLRPWIEAVLGAKGIDLAGGAVRLLSFPRIFGYAFNPLSVWYCFHHDGSLRAVLFEVRNTFAEHHGYLVHRDGEAMTWPMRGSTAKIFHVSPFLDRKGDYRFRCSEPGRHLSVAVALQDGRDPVFFASLSGKAEAMSDAALLKALIAIPPMALKVIAAIHWEALRLWIKGARLYPKPPPPLRDVS